MLRLIHKGSPSWAGQFFTECKAHFSSVTPLQFGIMEIYKGGKHYD